MFDKKSSYFDKVLANMKLAFSESDVVKIMIKKLSETEIELGKVISERDELEENLSLAKKEIKQHVNIQKEFEEKVKENRIIKNENRELKRELAEKNDEIRDLLSKLY